MAQSGTATATHGSPRPVVLTFARYFLPGFRAGGPIRSIANLVDGLGEEFEFRIVTLDRDFGDGRPYPAVATDLWTRLGKAWVMYVERQRFGLRKVASIAQQTPHDLVYLNSFFDPRFTQQVLLARRIHRLPDRPVLIAPRGEFSEGALQIKRFRKTLFINTARVLGLYKNATWHATSPYETADIRRQIKPTDSRCIVVAPNLSSDAATIDSGEARAPRVPGMPLQVCFLSRISRKKNLDYALRVLARVRVPIDFTIYGPLEDPKYWGECQALIDELPSNIRAVYSGELQHAKVEPTFRQHDVFFFPTRGENFGHVIQEALNAGLAILISDQTPWRGLQQDGVGWALPLSDQGGFVQVLDELGGWDASRFDNTRASAIVYAAKTKNTKETLHASRLLFRNALSQQVT
jgi:glycosyltransferase involved in cell wall biosynthesis